MELFTAAGIELPPGGGGRGRRGVLRSLRVPLFNYKIVQRARELAAFAPSADQKKAAQDYARKVKNPKFLKQKETAVRPLFIQDILQTVLGYRPYDPAEAYTLAHEESIRTGAVDVAIGRFNHPDTRDEIVAPFELKGPDTDDLDKIMPGRHRSPVQQAWDYAIDAPGSRWVLVSNCIEIRLYGFGRGRDAYEVFDLTRLDEEEEHARLWLVLGADRFLGGETDRLLRETDSAYKDITDELYGQYAELRKRLIGFLTNSADGPKLAALQAIEPAQKVLDRILFIAFAQRTDLLPDRLLEDASKDQNRFVPQPIWMNFLALFRAVDRGNDRLAVWAYNGGLFAEDPLADSLILPDDLATDVAKLGQWDYRREVPVTVLGHIFEQSITDIEKLKAESKGEAPPEVSKRKREGVVYTPDMVTRFLVERTIGQTLEERRAALWAEHGMREGEPVEPAREIAFWQATLAALRDFTIVDPACGSGAFLVAAFDEMARRYRDCVSRLVELGIEINFDIFDEIVTKNLHGVDVNAESVEITRLALWLKTARRDHRLQNLEATIKCGNSLIDDPKFTDRPFDWRAAFPDIFARGGFDVVIGNPPYVRSNTISQFKPYLRGRFEVYDGAADLYCFFYELSFTLVKRAGRVGYITSGSFLKTAFGKRLRDYLSDHARFECGVDFLDTKVFDSVTTYPIISIFSPASKIDEYEVPFLYKNLEPNTDLGQLFQIDNFKYPATRLRRKRWHFETEALWRLRDKIEQRSSFNLGSVASAVSGIKTGLTSAFVLNQETAHNLVAAAQNSDELLRPWVTGDELAKWHSENQGNNLIFIPKGWTLHRYGNVDEEMAWGAFSREYPPIANRLHSFETKLRSRSDKGDFWWELRACDYYDIFERDFIAYPEMSQGRKFLMNQSRAILNNKCFLLDISEVPMLAYLNTNVSWFLLRGICSALRGGQWRLELRADYLQDLPVPDMSSGPRTSLTSLGQTCTDAARARFAIQSSVRHRILDLAPPERKKLNGKLENWHELSFAGFRDEVKKAFHADVPIKERGDWEAYLAGDAAEVNRLSKEIATAEREIDQIVYRLFDLTPDEIVLLETSLAGQY